MAGPTGTPVPSENSDPIDPPSRSARTNAESVTAETYGFIERMSGGTEEQQTILREMLAIVRMFLTRTLPIVLIALVVGGVAVFVHANLPRSTEFGILAAAGSLVSLGGGGAALYRRHKKAKAAREQPRNQVGGTNPAADRD